MRKRIAFWILFSVFSVVCLTSCETINSDNNTSIKKGNYFVFDVYSSLYMEGENLKGKTVFFSMNSNDYAFVRGIETGVKEILEKEGVKTLISSDLGVDADAIIANPKSEEYYFSSDYYLSLTIKDGNAYNLGGGIANLVLEGGCYKMEADTPQVLYMYISAYAEKNDLLSFEESRKKAIPEITETFCNELSKYI